MFNVIFGSKDNIVNFNIEFNINFNFKFNISFNLEIFLLNS